MSTIKPIGWNDFQHYKDRSPSWIKLHRRYLDDYSFHSMQDASKALAPMLWLLASEYEQGQIPFDLDMLSFRLRADKDKLSKSIKELIFKGFFELEQDASGLLAECLPREEKRRGREEVEKSNNPDGLFVASNADDVIDKTQATQCPHQDIIAAYHEHLPMCPRIRDWTPARQTVLRARWNEDKGRQTLEYWKRLFAYVAESQFLTGRSSSRDHRPFFASLEWMLKPENFAKIREGRYHKEAA